MIVSPSFLVSIVVPILNEEEGIESLLTRLRDVVSKLTDHRWELIVVDDGSTDSSVSRLRQLAATFPGEVHVISLSRNFGHQPALLAGLQKAKGEAIIFIDADLQDPPELFPDFLRKFSEGYDVVYGVRRQRRESLWKIIAYQAFYRLFQRVADVPIPLDAGDFGLISRRVAQIVSGMEEQDIFLRGLRGWVGFRQIGIAYDRPARLAGETKYSLKHLLKLAGSAFFGYSSLPLRVATGLGVGSVAISLLYAAQALYGRIFLQSNPPGWTSLVMVILMLGGAQLITIGILGEYIGRIYKQSLRRPIYLTNTEEKLQ